MESTAAFFAQTALFVASTTVAGFLSALILSAVRRATRPLKVIVAHPTGRELFLWTSWVLITIAVPLVAVTLWPIPDLP